MFGKILTNPLVLNLGLISFFADIASEMLYPVTPIFLTTVLGSSMTYVGVIEGVAELISSLLKTYSGFWSDKIFRRKPFIIIGYSLSAIAKPLTGLAYSWQGVLFARGLDRTGKGLRTAPRDALLADSVPLEKRGEAFGWHRFMDTMGAVLGPLLAIFLISFYENDLRKIFLWSILPGIFSLIFVMRLKEADSLAPPKKLERFGWNHFSGDFKTFIFAWTIFSLGNSSDVFLLMRVKASGHSTTSVILLYCLYNLSYALLSPYFGTLSDKVGQKKCLIIGLGLFSIVYGGFIFATSIIHFLFLFILYGLFMASTEGIGKAYTVGLVSPERKASAVGVLGTLTGISALMASIGAGVLWDNYSQFAPFVLGMTSSLIACGILIFVKKK